MSKLFSLIFFVLILSCAEKSKEEVSSIDPVNWNNRMAEITSSDSLVKGTSYLSVYSEVYSETEHRTHNLTSTISMRNTNLKDTIYINKAEYFDTKGSPIRTYFDLPIHIKPNSHEPYFEGVMISTSGQQGLSFTTQGQRVE